MKFTPVSRRKNRRPRRFLLQALGFACLTAAALPAARAQTAYTWDGGTGNWSDGSMWSLMMAPNDPSADVFIDGGKTGVASVVALDNSYTVGRLTVDAGDTLNTNNGTTLTVSAAAGFAGSGSIIDNGTINVTGGYYNTQLVFNGPGSLSGTGTLNLAGGGSNLFVYENNSGDLLTVGAGFTVAGAGNLGNGQTTFANNGLINANGSGSTLNLQPGGGNAAFTNVGAGVAQASGGGILQLNGASGGVFTGDAFRALDNSQVNLVNGATVSNATLVTGGSGTVNNTGTATLANVTNNGVFNANNGTTTYLTSTLTNNGTFNVNGGYYNTSLIFNNPTTLAGTGTLQLNSGSNLYVYAQNSGDRLTINAGATVAGAGNLGNNQTTFLNNGLVNANASGLTLNVQPGGGNATFANGATGLAEATGGGTLQLNGSNGGIFAGGTFQALDGSALVLTNNPNVSGAILTTAGSGTVTNVNTATLTNVTNNGTFIANNSANTYLTGTLTNNGTFTAVGGYYNTNVLLTGPVTLAGTGTLNLGGGGGNLALYAQNSGDRLTINAGAAITGAGNLGAGQTTFTNRGLVNANGSGNTLTIQPGGTAASGTDFTNVGAGVAQATGGGTLQLAGNNGGVFTGGTFQALDASTLNLTNNPNVVGAILTTAGSGTVNNLNTATLTNVTNNGTFIANNSANTYLTGTLTNNGTFTAVGGYYNTNVLLTGPVTLAGTGTLNLGGGGGNLALYAQNSGDRLTINAGAAITGAGNLGDGQTTFLNNGTVNANTSGSTLTVQPGGGNATFVNGATGLAEATGGGTANLVNNSGGTFTNNGTFAVVSGSVGGNSALNVSSGALTNDSGATLTGGTYNVIATDSSATSTLSFGGGSITTNAANVTLSGANTVFAEISPLATNSGSFAVANGRNFTTVGALTNSGTLVAAGSTLTVTGQLTQTSAGTLTGAGTFAATGGFALSGNVNPGGTVSAATGAFTGGAGTTNLNGDAAFDVNTKFNFELGAITGTNDHLNVTGALSLNGTLNVAALPGFGTNVYDLIDYSVTANPSFLLTHGALALGTLPAGYTYVVSYAVPGQVDLVVVQNAIPEPGAWAFVLGGATLLLGAQRFRRQS